MERTGVRNRSPGGRLRLRHPNGVGPHRRLASDETARVRGEDHPTDGDDQHEVVEVVEIREPQEGAGGKVGDQADLHRGHQIAKPHHARIPFRDPDDRRRGKPREHYEQEEHREADESMMPHHLKVDAVGIANVGGVGRV